MAKRVDESAWRREGPMLMRGLRARRPSVRLVTIARICELFDPLVKTQARSYQHHVGTISSDLCDLEQVARMGLLEAIKTFRPRRGAFPTHAMWTIRNALSKYVEAVASPVRLPAWMVRRLPKLGRTQSRLAHVLGREPTRAELATALHLPENAIDAMRLYAEGPMPLPYEVTGVPFGDSGLAHNFSRRKGKVVE
jgi:DNA-directed RNA polymerase specialized sigma subunit